MSALTVRLGVHCVRRVGANYVIEFPDGSARPATELEVRMWTLLRQHYPEGSLT